MALDTAGQALRLWMLGQLATMIMVGVAIGVGLWAIGLPSALALGLIAAILEFIPFFGPIMSALPALLLAFSNNVSTVLWVLALIVVVQQAENNLIVPLIQRRTVELPPALGITSVVAFGLLFGWLGLFFGTPLTVVILVLVKYLYVRGVENEDVSVAGLEQAQAAQREAQAKAGAEHNRR
jgi:predicted PurR-regulated permease PerM